MAKLTRTDELRVGDFIPGMGVLATVRDLGGRISIRTADGVTGGIFRPDETWQDVRPAEPDVDPSTHSSRSRRRALVTVYAPDDPAEDGTHYHLFHHGLGKWATVTEVGGILDDIAWEG